MENSKRPYKSGMFGGKFIPMHKGHSLCISVALALCDVVHVILFVNGDGELDIMAHDHTLPRKYLEIPYREEQMRKLAAGNPRIILHTIDVKDCKKPDGTEDWDAETPLVLDECGKFDAVFSSEPSYDAYFKEAYPWSKHILVDVERKNVPVSATMIRKMTPEEAETWIIK